MANPTVILAVVLGLAAGFADGFAHHDELAARRFRELSPQTVQSPLDKSRNRRWHRAGFWLRLAVVGLLAAFVGGMLGSWQALALAFLTGGAVVSLVFDIAFNLRIGNKWDYAGTTAWFDEWLEKTGRAGKYNAARIVAALEFAGVAVGCIGWRLFV